MKILFISDIHGSVTNLQHVIHMFTRERADYIAFLGDALNHGPRNPFPDSYDPQRTAALLNATKEKIIAVKGNCDSEVDQMLIDYPMLGDYGVILVNQRKIFLTHGHIYHPDHLPNLNYGDILAFGHTHIPVATYQNGIYTFNPGSISLPKGNYPNSYGIYENNTLMVKDFAGRIVMETRLHD
jgi:putative phosphoesterase